MDTNLFLELFAPVVAPVVAPTTSSPAVISADGLLGFSWSTIVGWVIAGAGSLLAVVAGGKYLGIFSRSKNVLGDAIASAV